MLISPTGTFRLTSDEDLLNDISGSYDVEHNSDFSDNPQTFTMYLGSLIPGRVLQTKVNSGADQIFLTPTDTLPPWQAATFYPINSYRQPVASNGYRYRATNAGTSHATTEPTWPTSPIGATVVDNGVTWILVSKKHPTTEYKLSTTLGGLSSAIAGAALPLGTSILSGVENAVPIYVRITNTVPTPGSDVNEPDVKLVFTSTREF